MYDNITGIILSGGKSLRMGTNKSLMVLNNKTIIETVYNIVKPVFQNIILISNEPELYSFLNINVHKDIYPGLGPLSGIHSGLVHSETEKNFVISCDMPLMSEEMICYLTGYNTAQPITVAKASGFIQQLCGVYTKACLETAEEILKENIQSESRAKEQKKRGCKVLELLNRAGAEIIDAEHLPFYSDDLFFNMNRPDDFEYIMKRLNNEPPDNIIFP